jgi:Trypsin-co-occurring domain 1
MAELVRFEVGPGRDVLVETDDVDEGLIPVKRGDHDGFLEAGSAFTERIGSIRDAVREALKELREINPDEVTVSFGIKFTAEAGAVIAKTSVEGTFGVEMAWHRPAET